MKSLCILCTIAALVSCTVAEAVPRAQLFSPQDPYKDKRASKLWRKRASKSACSANKSPWVFARFHMANTEQYAEADWLADIQLAHNTGFDGFSLLLGSETWVPAQIQNAFDAAESSKLDFKLYVNFNMSSFQDPTEFLPFVTQYGLRKNQFIYSSKVFSSAVGGEVANFSATTPNEGWQEWYKDQLSGAGYPTYFVPSFPTTSPESVYAEFTSVDGIQSAEAWSTDDADLSNDTALILQDEAALTSKTFSLPVSGSYFARSVNSSLVRRTENWALASRWEQVIDVQPDFIEVLSWNGYDDSTYLGPLRSKSDPPSYAKGYPHTAWLLLSQFYIQRYKTGSYPDVRKDTLIYWYRTHSKDAKATKDPLGIPKGANNAEDAIYVVALMASSNASLLVKTGAVQTNTTLEQGINKVKVQFEEGDVSFRLERDGKTYATSEPGLPINNSIDEYNFNVFAGSLIAS